MVEPYIYHLVVAFEFPPMGKFDIVIYLLVIFYNIKPDLQSNWIQWTEDGNWWFGTVCVQTKLILNHSDSGNIWMESNPSKRFTAPIVSMFYLRE